jgi:hypothetical protein
MWPSVTEVGDDEQSRQTLFPVIAGDRCVDFPFEQTLQHLLSNSLQPFSFISSIAWLYQTPV